MNWSQFKKTWVMGQVCLLTFSVYFGSAIYTAGVTDVARQFNVSLVASTLGLTFFLLGAGTGWLFSLSKSLRSLLIRDFPGRAYALVANERDALHRPHAHLLVHIAPFRSLPNSHGPGEKLRDAHGIPLHHGLCRLTVPCNWRCIRGGHI